MLSLLNKRHTNRSVFSQSQTSLIAAASRRRRSDGAARGMAIWHKAVGVGIAVRRLIATLSTSAEPAWWISER
jgi:hypothetical protein